MSKSDALENSILLLLFNGTAIADLAENEVASPSANIEVALHTGDPGEAGTQLTSEATYGGYARVAVARTSGGWTVTGNSVSPAAAITFVEASSGSETITHFSVGVDVGDVIMYSGTVTPNIVVTTGVIPELTTASTITED